MAGSSPHSYPTPTILPLGDSALLVRFGETLSDPANAAAISLTRLLEREPIEGVLELVPSLVSVLLRYDPQTTAPGALAGELRLRLSGLSETGAAVAAVWDIPVTFDGTDLDEVATALGLSPERFIAAHNDTMLRVLATGFAPGFVYCGLHPQALVMPRRATVRSTVPAGSVLFAAGQTAIAATEMPTGWHVIGHTDFVNFDPQTSTPTRLAAGDGIRFGAAP